MTDQLHPGSHPDAERLSAFVEGALPDHERLSCLSHFAECERCREIIFSAQPARPPERLKIVPAKRGWSRPLPIFAAALATAALLTLLIMPRQGHVQFPASPEVAPISLPSIKTVAPPPAKDAEAPPLILAQIAKPRQPDLVPNSKKVSPPLPPLFPSPADTTTILASPNVAPAESPAPPPAPLPSAAPSAGAAAQPPRALRGVLGGFRAAFRGSLSNVNGSVHDPSGQAISGATVNLHPLAGGTNTTAHTNAAGEFTVAALPPGKYELQVESPGFQKEETQVELKAGELASLESTLQVGSATQTVEVSAAEVVSALPVGSFTTVQNGAHSVMFDGSGRLFSRKSDNKSWKAVKPKWQGQVKQVVLMNDLFQLTTDQGEVWLSPDGSHWHLALNEKK